MQRDEVRRGVERPGGLRALRAHVLETLGSHERVVGDHAHPEPERPPRDLLADPAEAEHAERLVRELDPAPARPLPAALLEGRVRLRDVPRERHQQPDGVLGGRDHRRLGRVGDDDAPPRRGLDVDVVDPDARAADHLQARAALDQVGGELRRRADDDRVVVGDALGEVAATVDVHVEPLAQEADAGVGDRLADEDARAAQTRACSKASSAAAAAAPRSTSAPSSTSASSTADSVVVMSKTSK